MRATTVRLIAAGLVAAACDIPSEVTVTHYVCIVDDTIGAANDSTGVRCVAPDSLGSVGASW